MVARTRRAPVRTREVLTRALDVFGDAWTFLVMQEAFFGVHRFVDFRANLRMPRATLAVRLRLLVMHGMLERSTREGSCRESYRLTVTGLNHYDYALALTRFGDRWLAGEDGRPLRLRHNCGRFLGAEPYCRGCGQPLRASGVRFNSASSHTLDVAFARKSRASGDPLAYLRGRTTSVARTLTAVGDRWSLLMIYELLDGPRRFEDFLLRLGMAPNILTDRLQYLTSTGLLVRKPYQRPLHFKYRLTTRGKDLYEVVLALLTWACRWLGVAPADRPRHRCGRPAALMYRCQGCGAEVKAVDVIVRPSAPTAARGAASSS
jgi:DNA-binding HxlR family transcriptional regulator